MLSQVTLGELFRMQFYYLDAVQEFRLSSDKGEEEKSFLSIPISALSKMNWPTFISCMYVVLIEIMRRGSDSGHLIDRSRLVSLRHRNHYIPLDWLRLISLRVPCSEPTKVGLGSAQISIRGLMRWFTCRDKKLTLLWTANFFFPNDATTVRRCFALSSLPFIRTKKKTSRESMEIPLNEDERRTLLGRSHEANLFLFILSRPLFHSIWHGPRSALALHRMECVTHSKLTSHPKAIAAIVSRKERKILSYIKIRESYTYDVKWGSTSKDDVKRSQMKSLGWHILWTIPQTLDSVATTITARPSLLSSTSPTFTLSSSLVDTAQSSKSAYIIEIANISGALEIYVEILIFSVDVGKWVSNFLFAQLIKIRTAAGQTRIRVFNFESNALVTVASGDTFAFGVNFAFIQLPASRRAPS